MKKSKSIHSISIIGASDLLSLIYEKNVSMCTLITKVFLFIDVLNIVICYLQNMCQQPKSTIPWIINYLVNFDLSYTLTLSSPDGRTIKRVLSLKNIHMNTDRQQENSFTGCGPNCDIRFTAISLQKVPWVITILSALSLAFFLISLSAASD